MTVEPSWRRRRASGPSRALIDRRTGFPPVHIFNSSHPTRQKLPLETFLALACQILQRGRINSLSCPRASGHLFVTVT
jgi:hypothetical protein